VLGGEWGELTDLETKSSEQQTLISDLGCMMDRTEIDTLLQQDSEAWENGHRILYVPTFYAIGKVK
jgi:hypothetical protein